MIFCYSGDSEGVKLFYLTVTDSIVIRGSTYFYLLLLVFWVSLVLCIVLGFVALVLFCCLGLVQWPEKNMLVECLFLPASGLMIFT